MSAAHDGAAASQSRLLELPDELVIEILRHLLPCGPADTFPPKEPGDAPYSRRIEHWTYALPASSSPIRQRHSLASTYAAHLRAVALVSRRANALATPLLYLAINLQTILSTNGLAGTLEGEYEIGNVRMHRAPTSPQLAALVRHLHLPNDGLLHGASDRMADKELFAPSLRAILERVSRLETLSVHTRPDGVALRQFLNVFGEQSTRPAAARESLRRLTISCLGRTPPQLEACMHAPRLSHLHLIQWIPASLRMHFGATIYQSLRVLRLSRIPGVLVPELLDSTNPRSAAGSRLQNVLRECVEECPSLEILLLEIEQLPEFDMPDGLTAQPPLMPSSVTGAGGFGAPFDQFTADQPLGQLATLDFPGDVPLTPEESVAWAAEHAERYYGPRDNYWAQVGEVRRQTQERADAIRRARCGSSTSGVAVPALDVRIVAPRPLGWDRHESFVDFAASVYACREGDDAADRSAFADPDVFSLVEQVPMLGHEDAFDRSGRRVAYWTGILPRSQAQEQDNGRI